MVKCSFYFVSFFTIIFSLFAKNHSLHEEMIVIHDSAIVTVIDGFESKNSFISYVTVKGVQYLLKQKKSPSKQFSVVRDAFAAWIAQDLHIAHSVQIIPSKKEFPGKKNMTLPAVLLTIAPGKTIASQQNSKYYNLSLKQRKIDSMLSPDRWLTETMIHQMTWHDQLPIIIALDLFICNTDRHRNNLFYNPSTDKFCAIDMDNIFRRNLPALAIAKLKLMIANKKEFTKYEIRALKIVKRTLQFLLDRYSVDQMVDKLDFFIEQAGFEFSNDSKVTSNITRKIARHQKIINESRVSLHELVSLLDKIINDFKQ